uniref:Uncharacterized protein n=1 Tax=Oryza barthii TaxID=65489 RepID=A0A0D3HBV4_9ORYZ
MGEHGKGQSWTVVNSPPPATHACSHIVAADASSTASSVAVTAADRVPLHVRAVPLGLECGKRAMGEHEEGQSQTVVTSPSPATHACFHVAAANALLHGVVGHCRRRRVSPRARVVSLGLERGGVVQAWTTTMSRSVVCGARRLRWEGRKLASPPTRGGHVVGQ